MSFRSVLAVLAVTACLVAAPAGCGDDDGGDDAPAADAGADAFIPPAVGQFPPGFLFGSAIAAYQVEGDLHNTDWYQWETLCGDECSGEAADDGPAFLTHYETDLDNAAAISNNALRLGIEWARVFPTQAAWDARTPDAAAVQLYHDLLAAARSRGIEPMVTLHHFSTPLYLQDSTDLAGKPGWESPAMADEFADFAEWAAGEYGAQVDWWITINEPIIYIANGWYSGFFPPGVNGNVDKAVEVAFNLIDGHAKAYHRIHAADTVDADGDSAAALVSVANHDRVFLPKNPQNPDDVRAAETLSYLFNTVFLDAIVYGERDTDVDMNHDEKGEGIVPEWIGTADYIGINYYGVSIVVFTSEDNYPVLGIPFQNDLQNHGIPNPSSDYGWSLYPEGFRIVLDDAASYGLPVVITENGLADNNDSQRPRFLMDHLYEIARAIDDGVDIRGYFHWSLMDNFEWASGFCPRFGLFRVDFGDPARPRSRGAGADVYKRIIDANTVPLELYAEYPVLPEADFFCPTLGP